MKLNTKYTGYKKYIIPWLKMLDFVANPYIRKLYRKKAATDFMNLFIPFLLKNMILFKLFKQNKC